MFGRKGPGLGIGAPPAHPDNEVPLPRPQQRISLDMRHVMGARADTTADTLHAARDPENPGPGSLVVGPEITLRGEISSCDDLFVEGFVAADAAKCRAITVTRTGAFEGQAEFDAAYIEGTLDGDLTVRGTLHVRGSGRVSGRVRYGRIVVEPGGQLSGDICAIDSVPPAVPQT